MMKWFKNILVVIALWVTALPCAHAMGHFDHTSHSNASEIFATHCCSCHSSEKPECFDHQEIPQDIFSVPHPEVWPSSDLVLLVLNESKPIFIPVDFNIYAPLIALQTVRLLI